MKQLVHIDRGDLNEGKTAIASPAAEEDYALDPLGHGPEFEQNDDGMQRGTATGTGRTRCRCPDRPSNRD